jgi:hypothetical protein
MRFWAATAAGVRFEIDGPYDMETFSGEAIRVLILFAAQQMAECGGRSVIAHAALAFSDPDNLT